MSSDVRGRVEQTANTFAITAPDEDAPAGPPAGSWGGGREKETIKHGVTPSREAMCFLMRYQHTIHVHFTHEISSSGTATGNFLFGSLDFALKTFFFFFIVKVKAKKKSVCLISLHSINAERLKKREYLEYRG